MPKSQKFAIIPICALALVFRSSISEAGEPPVRLGPIPGYAEAGDARSISATDEWRQPVPGNQPFQSPSLQSEDQPYESTSLRQQATANPGSPSAPAPAATDTGTLFDWSKYPETIHAMPRPGIFPIPPTQGPAHFSLWDQLNGECRPAPPKSGYAPFAINAWPFFDADWRYVDGIDWEDRTLVERLKRIPLNDCTLFSTGGEFWAKYHHEHNSRLTETENEYLLNHVRLYGDLWYSDWLRVYGEYVWADSFGETLAPVPPDVDRGDILDLFVDVKLFDLYDRPVYVRAGRQELLYGSQRLVTPLPWANKRHSFDGVKVFRQGEKWDFDAFWSQYVPPQASDFDTPDENQIFAGTWLTRRLKPGEAVDFFYIFYDNENDAVQQGIVRSPFQNHTFGSRWYGDKDGLLWDFEGAMQFGDQGAGDLFAGMATAGVGRSWKEACLTPTAWLYYDYASGDRDPTDGNAHTFNQQFPFGHYYMGWMDLVGRQNIHDVNAHLYLYPASWLTVWLQYHHFWLDQSRDALYNAGGVAYRRDPTGDAGHNVGDEIDVVLNFHLTRYSDIMVSYNMLFGGGFLEATSGAGQAADAQSLYLIFQQRW
jgi:hypothetical protein